MRPTRHLTTIIATLVAAALLPAVATAAPAVNGEFAVTEKPGQLTTGPDRNVWVVLGGAAKDLAKITPAGVVTEYDAADIAGAVGITTGGDGNLWVTMPSSVAKIDPANPTAAVKFAIADLTDARGITADTSGNLWAASGDKLIKIPTAAPATYTKTTITGMGARGIARGTDGTLWIADFGGQRIVNATTAGVPTFYATGGGPQEVAIGPGTQIAYSNPTASPQSIGRITPGGTAQATDVPMTDPFGIVLGGDGAYWTSQFAAGTLTRMTTAGVTTKLSGLTAGSGPRYLTPGPGNTLWVSEEVGLKVARVSGVEPAAVTPPADKVAPRVTRVAVSPTALRAGRRRTIGFTLSEKATVGLRFERALAGRRRGKACVKPTAALRRARSCTRYVRVATLTPAGKAGANAVTFSGRVGTRTLGAGRYRVVVSARDAAGNAAVTRTAAFTVLPAIR